MKKYDCIVMYSGGKDSFTVLNALKKKYNVLCITASHPFFTDENKNIVDTVIKDFNVDHYYLNIDSDLYLNLIKL